jgi:hypothetical protein
VPFGGLEVLSRAGALAAVVAASLFPLAGHSGPAPRMSRPTLVVSGSKRAVGTASPAHDGAVPKLKPSNVVVPPVIPLGIRVRSAPIRLGRAPFSLTTPRPVKHVVPPLQPGSTGPAVLALQRRLRSLGFWVAAADGTFDDSTEQAVYALQKAAGIQRDGVVGPQTAAALSRGVILKPRPASGYVIEVDLEHDLVMFVRNSKLEWALNTSTGGGYTYCSAGSCAVAVTPGGQFSIYSEVDGTVVDSLGELWRPKYFDAGFALHGDSYVPPFPVSHGCVRVSDEAIDWIWANNLAPVGTPVWVY